MTATYLEEIDASAFISMVQWAIGEPEALARFQQETGFKVSVPKCGLDQMIDEMTGYNAAFCAKFMRWCETELWGQPMPRLVREIVEAKERGE